MALVPFGSTKKAARYSGASGPMSKGRMPKQHRSPKRTKDSGPDPSATVAVPEVDGALRGHDTNYPRKAKAPGAMTML